MVARSVATTTGSGGFAPAGCRATREARPCRRLARPDKRDAIDLAQAVPAIAGQAQRPATTGDLATAQDRERDRIPCLERDRRPVDDDPTAWFSASSDELSKARSLLGPNR